MTTICELFWLIRLHPIARHDATNQFRCLCREPFRVDTTDHHWSNWLDISIDNAPTKRGVVYVLANYYYVMIKGASQCQQHVHIIHAPTPAVLLHLFQMSALQDKNSDMDGEGWFIILPNFRVCASLHRMRQKSSVLRKTV